MPKKNQSPFNKRYREFLADLQISRSPRVIVEGKDDKIFIRQIKDYLLRSEYDELLRNLNVDSVENIVDFDDEVIGNRNRVAYIIAKADKNANLIGFVDREFDNFEIINGKIIDMHPHHKIVDRVIYSRGHSTENYFHEKKAIIKALWNIYPIEEKDKMINLLTKSYDGLVAGACSISLCGKELKCLKSIREKTLKLEPYDIMKFDEDVIAVNLPNWLEQVKLNCKDINFEDLKLKLANNQEITRNTPIEILRWVCDGHIIEQIFSIAYIKCLHIILPNRKINYTISEDQRFLIKVNDWLEIETNKRPADLPIEVFTGLGISI